MIDEIDVVAINDLEKHAFVAEVKRNKSKININELKKRAASIAHQLPGYQIEYAGLSLENMWSIAVLHAIYLLEITTYF